ncbi:MAG: CARDB domain-containing protein, partial [Tepidisphaeraceae bacterium]
MFKHHIGPPMTVASAAALSLLSCAILVGCESMGEMKQSVKPLPDADEGYAVSDREQLDSYWGGEGTHIVDTGRARPAADTTRVTVEASPEPRAPEVRAEDRRSADARTTVSDGKMIRSSMAYPTGDRRTSVILIERIAPAQVRVGKPYEYDIKVTNLTDAPIQGVAITEDVPDNFRVTMADGGPATRPAGDSNRYAIGELGPRESKTLHFSALTNNADQNFASCMSVQYNPTLCTTAMVVNPQIRLGLQAPATFDVCEQPTLKYVVSNTGTGTASDVRVQHQLPEGLQTFDGKNSIAFTVPSLPQGQSKEFAIKLKPQHAGKYDLMATANSEEGEIKSEQISSEVVAPKLAVAIKGPEKDYAGKSIPYEVTVTNNGNAPAREAVVRLDSDEGAQFMGFGAPVRGNGTGDGAADDARLAADRARSGREGDSSQSLGTIEPGQSRTIRANLLSAEGGDMRVNAIANARCAAEATAAAQTNIQT